MTTPGRQPPSFGALLDALRDALRARLERHGLARRLEASVWDSADSPAAVKDRLFRRAGASTLRGTRADVVALGHALSRASGWTPDTLRLALRDHFLDASAGPAMRALAANPALAVGWLHTAWHEATSTHTSDTEWDFRPTGMDWIGDSVARLRGPSPLAGWTSQVACWGPLVTTCQDASRFGEEADGVSHAIVDIVAAVVATPGISDADLADLLTHLTEGKWANGAANVSATVPLILAHPSAGVATRAAFCMEGSTGREAAWVALAETRPAWFEDQAIVNTLSALRPPAYGEVWPIFLAHATPERVIAVWTTLFARDVPAALAGIPAMSSAAIQLLPSLSAHDIQQCLTHTASSSDRLAIIAALGTIPVQDTPDEPPAVAIIATEDSAVPPPVIPPGLEAHNPSVRAWLARHSPAYADFERRKQRHRDAEDADRRRRRRRLGI